MMLFIVPGPYGSGPQHRQTPQAKIADAGRVAQTHWDAPDPLMAFDRARRQTKLWQAVFVEQVRRVRSATRPLAQGKLCLLAEA